MALVPAIALGAASSSFAHSGTAEEQAACTPDVLTLCFWDIPSDERIVKCLNANLDKLSPACREVIDGPQAKHDDHLKH
jgi:hypothetical protein